MEEEKQSLTVCTFGNPLLDVVVQSEEGQMLLTKYNLKEDEAIEAEQWQLPMFEDVQKFNVEYVPGGSAQNTSRVLQRLNRIPCVTFFGCIGTDFFGNVLERKVREDQVDVCYMYDESNTTGVSVAIPTGNSRSLCASIGAAKHFKRSHLNSTDAKLRIDCADILYVEGYFLTHSYDSALYLGQLSQRSNKLFALNLSATYVTRECSDKVKNLLPFVDVVFGNASEFVEFIRSVNNEDRSTIEAATDVSLLPRISAKNTEFFGEIGNERIVVVTRASEPVTVVCGRNFKEFPVPDIAGDMIVDTIGAGDAFVGGFLSEVINRKSLEDCVKGGIAAAAAIVCSRGCSLQHINPA